MSLLLILGVFLFWMYAVWIIIRRGRLPDEEDIAPGPRSKPSERFYAQRRVSDRTSKKWRTERFKIGRRK